MKTRYLFVLFGTLTLGITLLVGSPIRSQEEQAPPEEGVEVLARGPVHEAYAEPSAVRPEAGPVVVQRPPEAVDELPPDQKPAGDDVEWLPGYWAWDEEQSQYLWVSGFWRVAPPGQRWVPGTWQQVNGGWQWVGGFWAPEEQKQVTYLPPPPPPLEVAAAIPAPDANSVFAPGSWVYRETRYLWRPGFWLGFRPGWVWIPAHYCWTPCGYVFVDGYWDRPLHERGLLFAPVRFGPNIVRAGFSYTPRYVVSSDFLMTALFIGPTRQHYFFGDYFADSYERRGFTDWVSFRTQKIGYDPNFAYYRREFADPSWERGLRDLYVARRAGDVPRPPRTLVQQTQVVNNITVNKTTNVTVNKNINITNVQNVTVLAPLKQMNNTRVTNLNSLSKARNVRETGGAADTRIVKLEAVSQDRRVKVQEANREFHQAAVQRRQSEAKILAQAPRAEPGKKVENVQPVRIELPKTVRTLAQTPSREGVRKVVQPPPRPPAAKLEERPAVRSGPVDRTPNRPAPSTERKPNTAPPPPMPKKEVKEDKGNKEPEKPLKKEPMPRKEVKPPSPPQKSPPPPADRKEGSDGKPGKGDGKPEKKER